MKYLLTLALALLVTGTADARGFLRGRARVRVQVNNFGGVGAFRSHAFGFRSFGGYGLGFRSYGLGSLGYGYGSAYSYSAPLLIEQPLVVQSAPLAYSAPACGCGAYAGASYSNPPAGGGPTYNYFYSSPPTAREPERLPSKAPTSADSLPTLPVRTLEYLRGLPAEGKDAFLVGMYGQIVGRRLAEKHFHLRLPATPEARREMYVRIRR